MKKQIPPFLAGVLTAMLVLSLGASALAASGRLTLEVDPVRIQVDGQLFQPKDVNGNDVPVFSYNGTTYAPLRALAEAYGLKGFRAGTQAEFEEAFRQALQAGCGCVIDCAIRMDAMVHPMVSAGTPVTDFILD